MSLAFSMVINEVVAGGMMMIGVLETRFCWLGEFICGDCITRFPFELLGAGDGGGGIEGRWGLLPSVTDLSVMPWYEPMVSILKPSVSETIRIRQLRRRSCQVDAH